MKSSHHHKKRSPFSNRNPQKHQSENLSRKPSELDALVGTEHIVKIEKMVVGGDGLARLQINDKSLVVFVAQSAPEDELKIKISLADKNFLKAEITEILKPSQHRTQPRCEYFGNCGGCNWQHITKSQQLRQKEQILKDLFSKFLPDITYDFKTSVESELSFNYRNRIQLKQLGEQLGYFKRASHDIVSVEHCALADEKISAHISTLRKSLRPAKEIKKFEIRLNQEEKLEHYPIGEDGEGLSFSQVNNAVNTKLVSRTLEIIKTLNPAFITELYAGAGNFTFPIAAALPEVRIESAELNSKLTDFAQKQILARALQKRVFAFTTACEAFARRRRLSTELILLDPPRSGCSAEVLTEIIKTKPGNILYISCHPAFLARDLKKIFEAHPNYRLKHVEIFNMFPQTDHFETLVWLETKADN